MSKAKTDKTSTGPNVMRVDGDPENREQLLADLTAEGLLTNAVLMKTYSRQVAGEIGITQAVHALRTTIKAVKRGDLAAAETVLVSQAAALNSMFSELARRAGLNMGEHLGATETYMRLALKAQAQCRATLETLAAIKNPPVVFARQANINNGGQQLVNNGSTLPAAAEPPTRTENCDTAQNELLEASHGNYLDARTPGAAGRTNQELEAVAAGHRATNP